MSWAIVPRYPFDGNCPTCHGEPGETGSGNRYGVIGHPRRDVAALARGELSVRVGMINDGVYPHRQCIAATWCHRLIRGMPEHEFDLVSIGDHATSMPAYQPPTNTVGLTSISTGGRPLGPNRGRAALAHRRFATHAAVLLCRGMMSDAPHSLAMFRSSLRRLAAGGVDGFFPLHGVPLAAVLLDAWRAAGANAEAILPQPALPQPTPADAEKVAAVLERALRVLSTAVATTDLHHATDASLSALVAMGAKWRAGTPFVLTEHDTYLTASILAETPGRPGVHAVLLRFLRALARLAYQEAGQVVVPTERLRRWALDHGADPAIVTVVGYGVDPHSCPPLRGEPPEPTIAFVGPDRDALTLLRTLPRLRAAHPEIRLIVAAPPIRTDVIGPDDPVFFLGPVNHRRSAYATGQVVVVSGRHPAAPYALIEAMMCRRPTICLDDGALTSVAGTAVATVPYDDEHRLADACLALLDSADRRRSQAATGSQRARSLFALRSTIDAIRTVYAEAIADPVEPIRRITMTDAGIANDLVGDRIGDRIGDHAS
jgi:polysaccharide biosynthesis protein PelF